MNQTNQTNLHSIWDVELINARINYHFQSNLDNYYEYLKTLMLSQLAAVNETSDDYQTWISESIYYVCKQVYFDDNNVQINRTVNFTLGENYFNQNWPVVDQRLAQAGRRLAALINNLAEKRSSTKISPAIQALITVISIEVVICIIAALGLYLFKRQKSSPYETLVSE